MTLAPTDPSTGRRGEPYRAAHERSTAHESPPRTWNALRHWFVAEWEASLPMRMHTRGVHPESHLGSPTLAGAVASRTGHATERGWGLTGWDRHGQPIGVDEETGDTRQPFLYHLERAMRDGGTTGIGARAVVRWAYVGWDIHAATLALYRHDTATLWETAALTALLERTIRDLWERCQSEPRRWSICPACRRRECVCGERSEAQVRAEEAG